jgi:hypothetical protein
MTTISRSKDRSDYRTLETKELLEEARTGVRVNWQELAVVLCERLYDKEWERRGDSGYQGDDGYQGDWNYCPSCGFELD